MIDLDALVTRRTRRDRWKTRAVRIVGASVAAIATAWLVLALVVAHGGLIDPARFARPDDALRVCDRHGSTLRHVRVDDADRHWVPLAAISPHLIDAVVATEDARFRDHGGVDIRAIVRSALRDLVPWNRLSGASTVTQQLVKRVYGREHGLRSKALEALRAIALERVFSKDEILEQYLNRLPFGDHIEGVERASEEYFGRSASELTVAEAALLAGVPQAPSATEPRRHLARALARRDFVLGRMRARGCIDEPTWRAALAERPVIREAPARPYEAPRFVDWALARYRSGQLASDHGTVTTSLDGVLQTRSEGLLAAAVDRFTTRGARNGAALVVSNATGEVLAYVGAAHTGSDAVGGQLDLVTARREPGSSLKPFVYELFFERGNTAATWLDDMHVAMTGAGGARFEARDYDGHERGPVRARVALASSLNLAALDAARRVGSDALVARMRALGFAGVADDANRYGPALVLGGAEVSPFELAGAFVTLARGGSRIDLSPVAHATPGAVDVMRPAAAAVAWDIVSDGRARADAFGADLVDLAGGEPFALKTGTSAGWHDAWASVADDRVTVVVWLGDPAGGSMAEVAGFESAAPTAARILAAARARFAIDGLVPVVRPRVERTDVAVCAFSGLRAGPRCTHVVRERFAAGTIPRDECTLHDASGRNQLAPRYAAWFARARPADAMIDTPTSPVESAGRSVPVVQSPQDGARFLFDPGNDAVLPLRAVFADQPATGVHWEVDGVPIADAEWHFTPGPHVLVARFGEARSRPAHVTAIAVTTP